MHNKISRLFTPKSAFFQNYPISYGIPEYYQRQFSDLTVILRVSRININEPIVFMFVLQDTCVFKMSSCAIRFLNSSNSYPITYSFKLQFTRSRVSAIPPTPSRSSSSPSSATYLILSPVSYTHLDVYKRQLWFLVVLYD